jgi:hypothetical protein
MVLVARFRTISDQILLKSRYTLRLKVGSLKWFNLVKSEEIVLMQLVSIQIQGHHKRGALKLVE